MNISELKLDLIHRIIDLPESKLRNVSNLLDSNTSDWWEMLSKKEQQAIDQGISEANRGEGIAHQEVMKRFKR